MMRYIFFFLCSHSFVYTANFVHNDELDLCFVYVFEGGETKELDYICIHHGALMAADYVVYQK